MSAERSREHRTTLVKGLSVLTSFSRETPSMTLSEVAKRTGLNAAVARRGKTRLFYWAASIWRRPKSSQLTPSSAESNAPCLT